MEAEAMIDSYYALVVRETGEGAFTRAVEVKSGEDLPAGEVLVKVRYSSLNYKDALSASGHRGVTRHYPHTPGIDAAGCVVESQVNGLDPGDEVIVSGFDLGMNTEGGFGQFIRVPASWVVKRPQNLTLRESMIYGTAGFTAAMCVRRLIEEGVRPEDGEVLVTGATGGVGSIAVALLAQNGYETVAATGKPEQHEFLRNLGASKVIPRTDVEDTSGRPLLSGRWAGVVDTVGGAILSTVLKATKRDGVVTCCGNVAAAEFTTSIFPFILRAVSLLGIDAANCVAEYRRTVWTQLAEEWRLVQLEQLVTACGLNELNDQIDLILQGRQIGRVLVDLWA